MYEEIYFAHNTKVCPMHALDLEKLHEKAYFNERVWVTEKLGLHPIMELYHDYSIQHVH
jgi:hypothetical protein